MISFENSKSTVKMKMNCMLHHGLDLNHDATWAQGGLRGSREDPPLHPSLGGGLLLFRYEWVRFFIPIGTAYRIAQISLHIDIHTNGLIAIRYAVSE